MSSLTWIPSCMFLLLLLFNASGSSQQPPEEPTHTFSVTLDDSNSTSTTIARADWMFHNRSQTVDIEANLTSLLNYATLNQLSLKLKFSSENTTLFQMEKCRSIVLEIELENFHTEVFLGHHSIEFLLKLANMKCSFENFDFYVVLSSEQRSNGHISFHTSEYLLPARSENVSDQVVYIDQHFRKNVVHGVDLDGLVDAALRESREWTVFLLANLSKPAEIVISRCGMTTIRLKTAVNETVEFTKDQLERLRMTTDMACSENMNSTFIDISVKCEERINGTVIFGLAYPKTHMALIASIVSFVFLAVAIVLCVQCKDVWSGWREGNRASENRQKRCGQGKFKSNDKSATDLTTETDEIEMGELSYPNFKFVPKKAASTEQVSSL